jgi:hypothetical protein
MPALDDARKKLRDFLSDMDALGQYADPNRPDAAPLVEAFAVARERALAAATAYVTAVKASP